MAMDVHLAANTTLAVDFTYGTRLIHPHPLNLDNRGCVAVARGAFIYCVETVDNPHIHDLRAIRLVQPLEVEEAIDTENFVEWGLRPVVLTVNGLLVQSENGKQNETMRLKLVPIFTWANRGKSDMRVWLPIVTSSAVML